MAEETTATSTATTTAAVEGTAQAAATTEPAQQQQATEPVLSSEAIQKMIQSTVDSKTAELGKTIATLKKENETLKKANMTAEQLAQADKEEFERQKAEVEFGKRQLHAHKVVAAAGYGDNAEAVVDIILGDTDEATDKRLTDFKSLVDKIVADTVKQTFKDNGRVPNGGNNSGAETKENKNDFAAQLGKRAAERTKQSNEILNHYYGGNK